MKKSKLQSTADQVVAIAAELRDRVDELDFGTTVPWVYNPLNYAWQTHEQYLRRYARATCRVLLLGMNPGPWGMAQTGVPFGEISAVVDFLGIDAPVGKPPQEHPKRPIEGLSCTRSEVSGERLWGLFQKRFKKADAFFEEHFVSNYCPLVFMEESAKNLTPDKLPMAVRKPLEEVCDVHLSKLIEALDPEWVIGVGGFAEDCANRVLSERLAGSAVKTGRILHPSPASPAANRDWSGSATKQLIELGIWK
jgi:single-strand selective monofunctional uracil DNA glycosylase